MSAPRSSPNMFASGVTKASSRRRRSAPKLKESCDCCATAKVRCTRERPACLRCRNKGNECRYSFSRRAGRKTMTRPILTEINTAASDSSSCLGSPVATPVMGSFKPVERTLSNASSISIASSFLGSYQDTLAVPSGISLHISENMYNNQDLNMWSQAAFISPQEEYNPDWYNLADNVAQSSLTTSQPHRNNSAVSQNASENSPTESETDEDSILDSVEFPPCVEPHIHTRNIQHPFISPDEDDDTVFTQDMPFLHSPTQESFLFAETEAIREELRLVANYVSTLEERVDRGVRCAGLHQKAAMEARALCGDFMASPHAGHVGVGGMEIHEAALVARFDASDLRRRLGGIRHEIESIVGFT